MCVCKRGGGEGGERERETGDIMALRSKYTRTGGRHSQILSFSSLGLRKPVPLGAMLMQRESEDSRPLTLLSVPQRHLQAQASPKPKPAKGRLLSSVPQRDWGFSCLVTGIGVLSVTNWKRQ